MIASDPPIIVDRLTEKSVNYIWRDRWGWIWEWSKWGDKTHAWGRRGSWRERYERTDVPNQHVHAPFTLIGNKPDMHEMLREIGIE